MLKLTAEVLEGYLTEYGWKFERIAEDHWSTGFQGDHLYYPLLIKRTQTFVSFTICPLILMSLEEKFAADFLMKEILGLNEKIQLVKLSINEFGELCLSLQIFNANFDFQIMSQVLGILCYYAEELAPDLKKKLFVILGKRQAQTLLL